MTSDPSSSYERHIKPNERAARVTCVDLLPRFLKVALESGDELDAYFCGPRAAVPLLQSGDQVLGLLPGHSYAKFGVYSIVSAKSQATAPLRQFEIDGESFRSLAGFYDQIEAVLCPGFRMGRQLDSLDDALDGGFADTFLFCESIELCWRNSAKSRDDFGHSEIADLLDSILHRCHPTASAGLKLRLAAAKNKQGPTLFEWLAEIIHDHRHITLNLA